MTTRTLEARWLLANSAKRGVFVEPEARIVWARRTVRRVPFLHVRECTDLWQRCGGHRCGRGYRVKVRVRATRRRFRVGLLEVLFACGRGSVGGDCQWRCASDGRGSARLRNKGSKQSTIDDQNGERRTSIVNLKNFDNRGGGGRICRDRKLKRRFLKWFLESHKILLVIMKIRRSPY